MGMFNIKIKTKNGNNIKEKVVFNVYFQLRFRKGLSTTALYTYKIYYSNKTKDLEQVFEIKDSDNVRSLEDLTIKVMINLLYVVGSISKVENLDPDVICFISTDLHSFNLSWTVLTHIFKKEDISNINDARYTSARLNKEAVDILDKIIKLNPNTHFYSIDPNRNKDKYKKSLIVCSQLSGRIEELQVSKQT